MEKVKDALGRCANISLIGTREDVIVVKALKLDEHIIRSLQHLNFEQWNAKIQDIHNILATSTLFDILLSHSGTLGRVTECKTPERSKA